MKKPAWIAGGTGDAASGTRPARKGEAAMSKSNASPASIAAGPDSAVPALVASIYSQSPARVRSKLIACLLGAIGPLAMAALAEGRFASFLFRSTSNAVAVSAEEALRVSEAQVLELARYVSQACPAAFVRVAQMLQAEDPMFARTLAGGLLVLALGKYMKRPPPSRLTRRAVPS
jgi:hypothetical protein